MTRLLQDIRFAARLLMRRPRFTIIAVLSLALGIGANTAIFSVVYAVLLRPLPYVQPDRLVRLYETAPKLDHSNVAPANLRDWRERGNVFSGLESYVSIHPDLQGAEHTERLVGTSASANLLGKDITLDGDRYTVVGVMPESFRFPANEVNDLWTSQQTNPQLASQRSSHRLYVVARLNPGVQLATARSHHKPEVRIMARATWPDSIVRRNRATCDMVAT